MARSWDSSTDRTSIQPVAAMKAAVTSTAPSVMRTRTDRSARSRPPAPAARSAIVGHEHVAVAADGAQAVAGEGLVDLAAEVADVDLDDVGADVDLVAPHLLQQP